MADDHLTLAGNTDWKQWHGDASAKCSGGEARYFAWHLARCRPAALRSMLEIGYGNRNFLGFARGRGIEVVGVEAQPALRERATAACIETHASVAELPPRRRFDLIVAFDVFEHVEPGALIGLLQRLTALLAPQGGLLRRVPNGESPFGRIFQHGDPTHVNTLGLSKLRPPAWP
jgi:SAM-dependent methyltransferase